MIGQTVNQIDEYVMTLISIYTNREQVIEHIQHDMNKTVSEATQLFDLKVLQDLKMIEGLVPKLMNELSLPMDGYYKRREEC